MQKTLHSIIWLWVPILIIVAQFAIEIFVPSQYLSSLHSEDGPHEMLQFIISLIALIYAFWCLKLLWPEKDLPLMIWVTCFCLGTAYIAGEEISWGQHIFDWGTSEFWININDQGETNLHNTSSWLDQKPRLILLLGTIIGGLIIPALAKFKPSALPEKFKIIYPPAILSVTAAFALGLKIIDKLQDNFDQNIFTRVAELEELYLYYFVLLYLITLRRKVLTIAQN